MQDQDWVCKNNTITNESIIIVIATRVEIHLFGFWRKIIMEPEELTYIIRIHDTEKFDVVSQSAILNSQQKRCEMN